MGKDSLIHVRLESKEAIILNRDILSSQKSLLRIMKRMNNYRFYRSKEMDLKASLYRRSKELKTLLNNLHKILPKLELPNILKKDEREREKSPEFKEKTAKAQDASIEEQLQEIQRRLNQLQA